MLTEIKCLQEQGQQPLLVLDLGKSIQEIEKLCKTKNITVLSTDYNRDKILPAESFYQATGIGCPCWFLLPGSDHGVLPESRNKTYDNQVTYMERNYPGYVVGGARELVTLAMLKYVQDETVLFPQDAATWGRCKEVYQTGICEGYSVELGYSSVSGSLLASISGNGYALVKKGLFSFLASR